MRRVLFTVAGLLVLLSGSISAVMIAGGRLNPNWALYLDHIDLCASKLCVFGIRAGVTPRQDMLPILQANATALQMLQVGSTFDTWKHMNVSARTFNGPIDGLTIIDLSNKLTVGAFIGMFGRPCTVSTRQQPGQPLVSVTMSFPEIIVATYTTDPRILFSPNTIIRWIESDSSLGCALSDGTVPWAGFRRDYQR